MDKESNDYRDFVLDAVDALGEINVQIVFLHGGLSVLPEAAPLMESFKNLASTTAEILSEALKQQSRILAEEKEEEYE